MPLLVDKIAPINQWDKSSIRPGPVGSIGDALTSVRIKQSMPDMDFAYDKMFSPKNDVLRGSNVQDGRWFSFSDGGANAKVKKRKMNNGDAFKTGLGWYKQDMVVPERYAEPKVSSQGRGPWQTQEAAILHRSGDMFKDLPGGYKAPEGVLPRGNQIPRPVNITDLSPATEVLPDGSVRNKYPDWSKPVLPKRTIPTTAQVMQSVVSNLIPTPNNNIGRTITSTRPFERTVRNYLQTLGNPIGDLTYRMEGDSMDVV